MAARLEELTYEHFAGLLQSTVVITAESSSIEATLAEVTKAGSGRNGGRDPFSIILLGPRTSPLAQRIYEVELGDLGTHAIFLVPIGPSKDGQTLQYQAIFS